MSSGRIQTSRLYGEPLDEHHRPLVRRMFQDEKVAAALEGVLPDSHIDRVMRRNLDHWDRHGFGIWHFFSSESDDFIGRAGLRRTELDGQAEVELAYAIMPDFWNRNYATEMSIDVLRVGFEQLRLKDVVCFTLTTNTASQRVMQKLGFIYEREGIHADLPHVFCRTSAEQFYKKHSRTGPSR